MDSNLKISKLKVGKSKLILITVVIISMISCKKEMPKNVVASSPWSKMYEILDSVKPVSFPDKIFKVEDFGAISDGVYNNTEAFKNAISKCTESGGGKVLISAGTYYTGPIHLEDNVNLHLEEGAVILFSTNPKDYYPLVHTSYEGTELFNYSPLIYAYKKKT